MTAKLGPDIQGEIDMLNQEAAILLEEVKQHRERAQIALLKANRKGEEAVALMVQGGMPLLDAMREVCKWQTSAGLT